MNIKRALSWLTSIGGTIDGTTIGGTTPAAGYFTPTISKGPAIITTFAGTISSEGEASSTTIHFSSAADAILAGYHATNPVLGTTLIAGGSTRYIVSWTDADTCVVDTAVAWNLLTAITSVQLPIATFVNSAGVTQGWMLASGNIYFVQNAGIGTITFGTSAAKVLAMGSGTAPTTSPADAAQVWVADEGGAAGIASLHMRDEVGSSGPVGFKNQSTQPTPTAKTTDVTLTVAELLTKIITGTHAAGATQTYTLPTGTLTDGGGAFGVDACFDWSLINLSSASADTITIGAGADHTIVGNPVVQSAYETTGGVMGNSATFRTRKTAANTFVTYRIS